MTVFAALKLLGEDESVLINPAHVAAIETANGGSTSLVRLAVTNNGEQVFYDIEMSPKEVWKKFADAYPRV
ncbi:hypothetical protein J4T85_007875 [Sinorhizobium medicae]|uniref:hypothetical protein n=1 Tax=Sinorhizobium medicae TaxID=110321 RepID=UPI001AAF8456|nr:hypothetical protein [Sinorhizobium medicae]MBO1962171.1 hypothetical protein [Sinorhizobium medicae]